MTVAIEQFDEFFGALYPDKNGKPGTPFPWQIRLANQVLNKGWPECIDLPTASGKTVCIDIAVFALGCQASLAPEDRTAARRIFFSVNRRVIVDEAYDRSFRIAQALLAAESNGGKGILGAVARALRQYNEENAASEAPPLAVAQIRGCVYGDTAWARSLTQPTIVCTTADQVGSRLLFRGYGVSDSMKTINAALCGCDSLVILDEAHVTRALSQTMQLLPRYQAQHSTAPGLTFVQMTATPTSCVKNRFQLNRDDLSHPVLKARQGASKRTVLVGLEKKNVLVDEIVRLACGALSPERKVVGVIVNRVHTAREVEARIRARMTEAEVHLVIGRMRPIDRDMLQGKLRKVVGPNRSDQLEVPVFVVATQCLEVGADCDFDSLVTECASIDALRQRFGRLNRQGRPIEAYGAIVASHGVAKGGDSIYGDAIKHTWEWLTSKKVEDHIDFGIAAFQPLWDKLEEESNASLLLSPAQDASVLLPAHLDALCQTSPEPCPSPEVSCFIHGPQRDNTEVNVCWRADLGDFDEAARERWPEIVRLLPPASLECMTVPLREIRRWLGGQSEVGNSQDCDLPVNYLEEERERYSKPIRHVVVWRGTKDSQVATKPAEIRPGDTIVVPVSSGGWMDLGHVPDLKSSKTSSVRIDVAEIATRRSRRTVVVRIHPSFPDNEPLRILSDAQLRAALAQRGTIPPEWLQNPVAHIERHPYPGSNVDVSGGDKVIVFRRMLEPDNQLELPGIEEDEIDDNLSQAIGVISLVDHTQHVVDHLAAAAAKIRIADLSKTLDTAARLHDAGKADVRFQAMLAGITPYEAMQRPTLLGKGQSRPSTVAEKKVIRDRAMLPPGFRHEILSTQIVESYYATLVPKSVSRDLLLHLIASHHGHARPFAPVVEDNPREADLLSIEYAGVSIGETARQSWTPAHRLDSGISERFWGLTRKHGWWGLAWLEAILRLADKRASAVEEGNFR